MFNRFSLAIINMLNYSSYSSGANSSTGGGANSSTGGGLGGNKTSAAGNVTATAQKVNEILRNIAGPILTMLGSAAVIYAVVLGVQYAKAEDDGKRTELKKRVVNTVIGIAVMFVLAAMCLFIQWDAIIDDIFGYAW